MTYRQLQYQPIIAWRIYPGLEDLCLNRIWKTLMWVVTKTSGRSIYTELLKYMICSPDSLPFILTSWIQWMFVSADRRIGVKAEDAGAALLTLNLLRQNIKYARRAAACLWVIQVFSSSGRHEDFSQIGTQLLSTTGETFHNWQIFNLISALQKGG